MIGGTWGLSLTATRGDLGSVQLCVLVLAVLGSNACGRSSAAGEEVAVPDAADAGDAGARDGGGGQGGSSPGGSSDETAGSGGSAPSSGGAETEESAAGAISSSEAGATAREPPATQVPMAEVECCGCLDWAVAVGGPDADWGGDLAVAEDGSTIVTGSFVDRADFGDTELVGRGLTDAFVARLDETGEFVWASSFASSDYDVGGETSVGIAGDGSLRLAGNLRAETTFGYGTPQETTAMGDVFLSEFSEDGDFSWITTLDDSTWMFVRDLDVASNGDVVLAGDLNGTATFGAGQDGEVVRQVVNSSFFGASYDAAGSLRWVVGPSGASRTSQTMATGVDLSPDSELLVTGMVSGISTNAVLGEGQPEATSLWGANGAPYVARYRADGTLSWARQALPVSGGVECTDVCVDSYGQSLGNAVAVAADGGVLVAGFGSGGQFTFGQGESTEVTIELSTSFLARWSADGSFEWVTLVPGWAERMVETADGSIWIAGSLPEGSHVFGAGEPSETQIDVLQWQRPDVGTSINVDAFVARYDAAGNFLCVWHPRGEGLAQAAWGIDAYPDGGVVVAGYFEGQVDFGGRGDEQLLTAQGAGDVFVVKLLP